MTSCCPSCSYQESGCLLALLPWPQPAAPAGAVPHLPLLNWSLRAGHRAKKKRSYPLLLKCHKGSSMAGAGGQWLSPEDVCACGSGPAPSAWHQLCSDAHSVLGSLLLPQPCHLPPSHPLPLGGLAGLSVPQQLPWRGQEGSDMEITPKRNHPGVKDGMAKPRGYCGGFRNPSASWA